ncbi:hypothetical protein B7493_21450, partial [Mycobacterium tuberculosis variant bovis]
EWGLMPQMKIQGRTVGGQMGMLLTGSSAKSMDLKRTTGELMPLAVRMGTHATNEDPR